MRFQGNLKSVKKAKTLFPLHLSLTLHTTHMFPLGISRCSLISKPHLLAILFRLGTVRKPNEGSLALMYSLSNYTSQLFGTRRYNPSWPRSRRTYFGISFGFVRAIISQEGRVDSYPAVFRIKQGFEIWLLAQRREVPEDILWIIGRTAVDDID